jgi:oxygen-dependent protoporphyrinogen oxidase
MRAVEPAAPRIVVVGGGVAGLAAARRLVGSRPDAEVIVFEASPAVGGKLRRRQVGGAWVDVGAEAMLARRPEGVAAAAALGLNDALLHPLTTSALLRNRGRNRPLPGRTLMGIPGDIAAVRAADVLSGASLDLIAAEPHAAPLTALDSDISVGDLVTSRFGAEVVERIVDPLLGGVYAGRASSISIQAAIPGLARRLMTGGGSLLEATRSQLASSDSASPRTGHPAAQPVFASIEGGLARLAESMAAGGGFTVRTDMPVRQIRRTPVGFALTAGSAAQPEIIEADAVVLATPASKASALLAGLAPMAAAELAAIETASMAIVTLAFGDAVPGPGGASHGRSLPPGSGILVPSVEGLHVKAMTFSSQKWPGVGADGGVTLMRASLGRAGEEWALQRADDELVATVRAELATVTGLRAVPVDTHVQRWGGALPQYALGHLQRVERIRAAVAGVPGMAVCGATYDGVGIPACIASAHMAADRVVAGLNPKGQ